MTTSRRGDLVTETRERERRCVSPHSFNIVGSRKCRLAKAKLWPHTNQSQRCGHISMSDLWHLLDSDTEVADDGGGGHNQERSVRSRFRRPPSE